MDVERLRYYSRWHRFANERRYDGPADPWKLLDVDPNAVETYNSELRLNWGVGRVQGGDWDREEHCTPLQETNTCRGLRQRFEAGCDWEETDLYRQAEERIEECGTARGYDSIEAFRDVRCEHIDDLYHSIEQEGYRPNEAATHETPADASAFEDAYVHHLEPLVLVGRDGDIYLTEGLHRFTIASILDLEEIPVYVLCRHEQWQRVRDRLHDVPVANWPDESGVDADHPDLQDVRP